MECEKLCKDFCWLCRVSVVKKQKQAGRFNGQEEVEKKKYEFGKAGEEIVFCKVIR